MIENQRSQENPQTVRIAARSAVATLDGLVCTARKRA